MNIVGLISICALSVLGNANDGNDMQLVSIVLLGADAGGAI
jgi:hypothetical protein